MRSTKVYNCVGSNSLWSSSGSLIGSRHGVITVFGERTPFGLALGG